MPAAIDFVPIKELDELVDVLRLAILVIDVESVLVHVAHDKRLAEPQDADLMHVARDVVRRTHQENVSFISDHCGSIERQLGLNFTELVSARSGGFTANQVLSEEPLS